MHYLRVKVNECNYQENDRQLKEQFLNGTNDKAVVSKIIQGVATIKKASKVTGEHNLDPGKKGRGPEIAKSYVIYYAKAREFNMIKCKNTNS